MGYGVGAAKKDENAPILVKNIFGNGTAAGTGRQ